MTSEKRYIVLGLLVLGAVLGVPPAFAGDLTDEAALAAHQTREEHCSDVGTINVTKAAASVTQVATVWQQVSEAYEAEQISYILYWRGMLAQCLGYDDKAVSDLSAFIKSDAEHTESAGMLADARRRLNFLERGRSAPPPPPPSAASVLGVGFLVGSGVLGALSISQGVLVLGNDDEFKAEPHDAAGRQILLDERAPLVAATNGLGAAAIGCFTASLVSFGVHLATSKPKLSVIGSMSRQQPLPKLSIGVGPTGDGGLAIGLGGRW